MSSKLNLAASLRDLSASRAGDGGREHTLRLILENAAGAVDADRSSLFLVDRSRGEVWSRIALGLKATEIRMPLSEGLAGHVATTGETVNVAEAHSDPRFKPEIDAGTGYPTRTILCMPLRDASGNTLGVIEVLNKRGGPFSSTDEATLSALCAQVAILLSALNLERTKSADLAGPVASALARVPLFAEFSGEELEALLSYTRPRRYRADEVIFEEHDPGTTFHLIESGLVRVFRSSPEGQDIVLALLRPGEFFGELALIDGFPRSASAAALEPAQTLEITRGGFQEMLRRHPTALNRVCVVLARRLRRSDGIIADAAFLDLRARLAKRLLELAHDLGSPVEDGNELTLPLRQHDLAQIVGATRESVNRSLSAMEQAGVITLRRGRIGLLRLDELARLADQGL